VRIFFVVFVAFLASCGSPKTTFSFQGEAWGTRYNIVAIDPSASLDRGDVQSIIDDVLQRVDVEVSNWNPDSEVSQFNASTSIEPQRVSEALGSVIATAELVHQQSNGKFDITLAPLIELWGFGPRTPASPVPADEDIMAVLDRVGQSGMLTFDPVLSRLAKARPDVTVNLSAIAKGYGIDELADALRALGINDFLVEVGGDLMTSGVNPQGEAWRIGIEQPDAAPGAFGEIVELSDLGMATSGDYRNYFEEDGVRYSHIIDGETGRPVTHRTASVTVLADSAMAADAWATALLVLGAEDGMVIAENEGLAALFLVRDAEGDGGGFSAAASPRFEAIQNSSNE